jgi:glycosyltransferase involved in cell wall biosynthesis
VISFILPAHDEEALIGRSLAAIHSSARAVGRPYEVIVANDSSTDRTGEIARQHSAQVVTVDRRQIAAARNAGAAAASGEILLFVDADTQVTVPALARALRTLDQGAIGGGACVRFDGPVPAYAMVLERLLRLGSPHVGLAAGCFLFCTRKAYLAAGRFDETLFWAEEVAFARQLKRLGRFVVLRECVITSGRKLRTRTALDLVVLGVRLALAGGKSLRDRHAFWYGPRNPAREA